MASGWPEAAICVQDLDVQCVLQFTLINAAGCALHRRTNRVIHRQECLSRLSLASRQRPPPTAVGDDAVRIQRNAYRRKRPVRSSSTSRRQIGGTETKEKKERTSGRSSLAGGPTTSVCDDSLSLARTAAFYDGGQRSADDRRPFALSPPRAAESRRPTTRIRYPYAEVRDTGKRATSDDRRRAQDRRFTASRRDSQDDGLSTAAPPFRGGAP